MLKGWSAQAEEARAMQRLSYVSSPSSSIFHPPPSYPSASTPPFACSFPRDKRQRADRDAQLGVRSLQLVEEAAR